MIIGGAEDKLRQRAILTEFVAASGGPEARIAVIPTASSLGPEVVGVYDALFRKLGAAEVVAVRPETREDAHDEELVKRIGEATGIFMTGGNQLKLSAILVRHPAGRRPRGGAPSAAWSWRARRPARASSPATWSPSAARAPPPSSG